MKYWYVIDKDNNLIYLRCKGKIKAKDLDKPTTDIRSNVLYEKGMNIIADLTEAKAVLDSKNITLFREYLERIQDIRVPRKCAVIAPKNKTYEFVEMLSSISDELNIDIEPFRDYKNAVKWIMVGSLIK
jgi:hypothetical protein